MSLAQRLNQVTPTRHGQQCLTCAWLAQQTEEDRQAFTDWVTNGWSIAQLRANCLEEGLEVSETSFGRHIRNCIKKQTNESR